MSYFCPSCKAQAVPTGQSPNGGLLYVAEELSTCTEFYDDATAMQCTACEQVFYVGAPPETKQ